MLKQHARQAASANMNGKDRMCSHGYGARQVPWGYLTGHCDTLYIQNVN